jgi:alkanesulfonate monooxygenase SsuD/methylene tetrahydromethanopterin reductase-like flavin-dependent oxidoreductase (luciferase family)
VPTPDAISDNLAERIEDAFGLFGSPEHCADRLLRAHEDAGVEHVFLFPAHTVAGAYEMPEAEVEAVPPRHPAAPWRLSPSSRTPCAVDRRVSGLRPG